MSVPKAHVTPKLESLPKGLKDKAEAIIKKKFGLETTEAKAPEPLTVRGIQEAVNHLTNGVMDSMAMRVDPAIMASVDRRIIDLSDSDVRIESRVDYLGILVIHRCRNCNHAWQTMIDEREAERMGYYELRWRCRCDIDYRYLFSYRDYKRQQAYEQDRHRAMFDASRIWW